MKSSLERHDCLCASRDAFSHGILLGIVDDIIEGDSMMIHELHPNCLLHAWRAIASPFPLDPLIVLETKMLEIHPLDHILRDTLFQQQHECV